MSLLDVQNEYQVSVQKEYQVSYVVEICSTKFHANFTVFEIEYSSSC